MDIILRMQIVAVVLAAFADLRPQIHDTPPGASSTDALNTPDLTPEVARVLEWVGIVCQRYHERHVSAVIVLVL